MDKDQGSELIQDLETDSMSPPRDLPHESTEMRPPKPPDKVALSSGGHSIDISTNKRHHHGHGHGTNSTGRRNTGDTADSVIQTTERVGKPKEPRFGDNKFSLRPETPYHYTFQPRHDSPLGGSDSMPSMANTHDRPRRQAHARGDACVMHIDANLSRAQIDTELKLWRENAELHKALDFERDRATQAERVADDLRTHSRTKEMQFQAGMLAVANGSDALGHEATKLRQENLALKAELDDARSHIFSLQPYRKELMPKEVEQDFDDLVTNVNEWVQKFADPVIDDQDSFQHAVSKARKDPDHVSKLRTLISKHPDLIHGCLYPETDVDILISLVLRYLNDNIFQKVLPGSVKRLGEDIAQIEGSMQSYVKPQRDQFAIRTWRAEAFNAILCSPDYVAERKNWMRELTLNLVGAFKLFRRDRDFAAFCYSCQDNVIKPALALHEKLLTSTHHFYLDTNPHIVWNQDRELEMSPDFFEHLDKLQCDNILQNRKHLNLEKLEPRPTMEDLRANLTNVLTLCPGLYMRQIGKGDAIKAPVVVRKQQVLVAYGGAEKKQKFMEKGQRTLMSYIYFGHKERGRTSDSPWTAWRQITWG